MLSTKASKQAEQNSFVWQVRVEVTQFVASGVMRVIRGVHKIFQFGTSDVPIRKKSFLLELQVAGQLHTDICLTCRYLHELRGLGV
jgi:hypothetical protein